MRAREHGVSTRIAFCRVSHPALPIMQPSPFAHLLGHLDALRKLLCHLFDKAGAAWFEVAPHTIAYKGIHPHEMYRLTCDDLGVLTTSRERLLDLIRKVHADATDILDIWHVLVSFHSSRYGELMARLDDHHVRLRETYAMHLFWCYVSLPELQRRDDCKHAYEEAKDRVKEAEACLQHIRNVVVLRRYHFHLECMYGVAEGTEAEGIEAEGIEEDATEEESIETKAPGTAPGTAADRTPDKHWKASCPVVDSSAALYDLSRADINRNQRRLS